jgi:hypothetical protein
MHCSPRVSAFVRSLVLLTFAFEIAQPAATRTITTMSASGAFRTLPVIAFDGIDALSSLLRIDADVVIGAPHPTAFDGTLGTEVTVTLGLRS